MVWDPDKFTQADIKIAEGAASRYKFWSDYDDIRADALFAVWKVKKINHGPDYERIAFCKARWFIIDGIRQRTHRKKVELCSLDFDIAYMTEPQDLEIIDQICYYVMGPKRTIIRYILECLAQDIPKQDIAQILKVDPSRISRHLEVVKEAYKCAMGAMTERPMVKVC